MIRSFLSLLIILLVTGCSPKLDDLHAYTQSVKEYTINNHSGEESLQSCYCPDCFYSDNSNSNVSLAIVALSPWLMPVTIESDNFFEVFVTLKRSIPPDDRPPIAFLLHT